MQRIRDTLFVCLRLQGFLDIINVRLRIDLSDYVLYILGHLVLEITSHLRLHIISLKLLQTSTQNIQLPS